MIWSILIRSISSSSTTTGQDGNFLKRGLIVDQPRQYSVIIFFAEQVYPVNFHYLIKNLDDNKIPTRGCWTTLFPGPRGVIKADFEIKFAEN